MRRASIVLCGGKSSRMGMPKAKLPFGPDTMLTRVLGLLSGSVSRQVVVAAENQSLPDLPVDVQVVRDRREGRGPLEGLHAGLLELLDSADAVFVTSCDVPLLKTEFVDYLFDLMQPDLDIVVPRDDEFHHPLSAVYRPRVVSVIEQLLRKDELRPRRLFDRAPTLRVHVDDLRGLDPKLDSLRNLNSPQEYVRAVAQAGFQVPDAILRRLPT